MNGQAKKQCSQCGNWTDSSAAFCPVCGSQTFQTPSQQPQQPQPPRPQEQIQYGERTQYQGHPQQSPAEKKSKKGLIIGVAIGLVVLLLFVFVLFPAMTGKRRPRPDAAGNSAADTAAHTEEILMDAGAAAAL